MSITLIQKEIMLHVLSARFVALLLMCVLLIPLNFHINYRRYLQRQVDYQEAVKKEAGTIRITLANALPRDIFLWSKLIGGYLVFIVPFLVSLIIGLLVLVLQGFPLAEPDIYPRVFCLIGVSLLYIAVFFALGSVISIYFDSSKTALIVAFTIWVFTVLILPRVGFLAAQIVAPTPTAESVYREKAAKQAELRAGLDKERSELFSEMLQDLMPEEPTSGGFAAVVGGPEYFEKMNEKMAPLEEAARLAYRDFAAELDQRYQQQRKYQEEIGINLSRITPTSSFISLATDATQTGQAKRNAYFQTGIRYYETLDAEMFSKMSETAIHSEETPSLLPPPSVVEPTLEETLQHAVLDLLLLCFFAGGLTTAAFLKFFRADI